MILTCDRKIIDIYLGIFIIEVAIKTIITTIVLIVFTTITPIFIFCVIFYWIWINECDDFFIGIFKTIPTDSIIVIVFTTCIRNFFYQSRRSVSSYDYINGLLYYLHWTCGFTLIKSKY